MNRHELSRPPESIHDKIAKETLPKIFALMERIHYSGGNRRQIKGLSIGSIEWEAKTGEKRTRLARSHSRTGEKV